MNPYLSFKAPKKYLSIRVVLLAVVLLSSTFIFSQAPVANFTSDLTSGCAPLLVRFTDQSTGTPTGWRWELGNGTISSQPNPSTIYLTPGQYTVKLVVTNASGKDSIIRTNYIQVLQPPQVAFSATNAAGCFPLRVQFTDNSVPTSGTNITTWEWDFGDGTTSTERNPLHVYYSAGNFNVTLKVTGSNNCNNSLVKASFIRVTPGVRADFNASAPINCKPPEAITFTNTSTGPPTLTYAWDFGDGNTSVNANPVHTYTTAGTFSVRLITTSSQGCVDTIIKNNQLNIGNYNSNFSFRNNVCIGDTVQFTNLSVPAPNSATWFFSDGSQPSIVTNPIKIFNTVGNVTVKLVNNYGNCLDSVIKNITIINNPIPDINANQTVSCRTPFTVNFSNTTPGVQQWTWDFGDGNTSTLPNPTHTYTTEGEFTVRLTVRLSSGCSGTFSRDKFIIVKKPQVTIANMPAGGCFPYTFTPVPVVNTADAVVSWLWNFGDGNTSTSPSPSHTYTGQGKYTVTLTITTSTGCTETVTYVDGVKTGTKPTANFSATPLIACAGQPINFTDLSTGQPDEWKWVFGDGTIDTARNPTHRYDTSGVFSVKLIAFKNGCPDSIQRNAYITILPPVSKFGIIYNCSSTSTISFADSSFGALSYSWNFGDGGTSTLAVPPPYTYATPGTYTVTLTVTNGSCQHTSSKIVNFLNLSPVIAVDQAAKCRFTAFNFSATNLNLTNVTSVFWDMGDGFTSTAQTPSYSYATTGTKTVKLVVTDLNGCKDSTLRDINVYGPVASFTVVPQLQCTNQNVVFNSTSTTDGTHPITNYLWRFGDGNSINSNNAIVQNAYANPSSYLPKLIVTDSYGCVDSTLGGVVVDIIESRLGFTVTDSLSCPGGVVQFNNTSAGNNLSYTWDFGDGGSATVPNPQHSYAAPGVYTVKLIGRESIGCLDSIIKTRYITVDNPVADFTVSDTFTICPPLQVQFSNRSTYFRSLVWDFGDGNTSTNENPSYSYAIPGTYNISLTVTSPGGCTDVKTGVIKVLSNTSGSLTYSPLSGCFPVTSNFIVSANNRVQYLWDFGDGNTLFTSDSTLPYKYEFPGFYVPKVILQDEEGCLTPLIGRDTIKIFGAKAEFGLDKTVLCNNGTIQFRDSSITSDIISNITWNFGDGNSVSGIKNPVHTYTATGAYTVRLTVSTLNNCTNSKDTVVKVVPSPQVNISGNLAYCAPASINLNGNWLNPDTSSMNWAWKIDTVVARTQNLTSLILNNPNTYTTWFVATNSSGCADSSSAVITVNQVPSVDAGKDSTICLGNSLVLLPSGANNYLWTPAINLSCTNCENPSASPTDKIKYYVTGTSLENCSNTDSVTITVLKPFTITATGNDTICINQSVQLNARTADSYLWTPSTGLSNASIANPVASPLVTTTYTVTGFDQYRCFSSSADVTITVYEPPVINAGRDTTINAGSSAQLLPTLSGSISSLLWTPATGLSCTNCPNPVATPVKTTTYRLTARNPGVCISTDEVTVVVLCDKNKIFIPNAFTPNGDNLNDLFYISGTGITSVKSFRIYDRWGNKVFERTNFDANDPAFGWNGIYKSQEVAPGVFNYIAEIACSDGSTIPVQGNVTVIR